MSTEHMNSIGASVAHTVKVTTQEFSDLQKSENFIVLDNSNGIMYDRQYEIDYYAEVDNTVIDLYHL